MSRLEVLIQELCPDGVEYIELGNLCQVITKGTTPDHYTTEGINYIKIESIIGNRINLSKVSHITYFLHTNALRRSILKENDILFGIAGAIGRCAIVDRGCLPANTNQALAVIRLQKGTNPRYIYYYLQSKYVFDYILSNVTGSAQPNLSLRQISKILVPLPPLPVQ